MSDYFNDRLLIAIVGIFLLSPRTYAAPGLPYEQLAGQLQVELSEKNRVPQVEFQTEPLYGATILKETDYRGDGQFPLEFTRIYVSPQTEANCDDNNWTHNYASCLLHFPSGVTKICRLGICTTFLSNLKPESKDVRDTLVANGMINGTSYRWVYTHFNSGIREAYNSLGLLVARFDRSGIEHNVSYHPVNGGNLIIRITHVPSGRALSIGYNNGQLVSMTDPNEQTYTYSSIVTASTSTLTLPAVSAGATPLVRTYTYRGIDCGPDIDSFITYNYLDTISEGGKTLLKQEFGICGNFLSYSRIAQAGHNSKDRIQQRSHVNGSVPTKYQLIEQFADSDAGAYRSFVNYRTYTNLTPSEVIWLFRPSGVQARCANCEEDFISYSYNPQNGDLLSRTDYLGRTSLFSNNERGLPLTETEAYGTPEARTTTRTWDSRFPLKTSETRGGITHEWRYNDRGHVVKEMVHPSSQVLVNDSCPTSATWPWLFTCHEIRYDYSYDPDNHVVLRVVKTGPMPENGSTVTEYRSNGDLWKTTNALGQVEEVLSVNTHGQVTERVDHNGRHTVTTYNALRQPTAVSIDGDLTQYSYTTNGRLQSITRPDGTALNYTHTPAGSVKTVSRTTGTTTEQVEYKRDSRGNILETVASKTGETPQRWLNSYDEAGRLIRASDGTGSWHTDYRYNANNLETRSCRSGEICDLTGYTALDQINSQATAPLLSNGTLGTQTPLFDLWYDQAGRVSKVADPNGVQAELDYNEIDKPTEETSPDFGTRNALFDRAGNERMRVDADYNATDKFYDSLDRLREAQYSDSSRLKLTWDTPTLSGETSANYVGRLARQQRSNFSGEGTLTVTDDFRYNARGDVTGTVQSITNQTTFSTATAYTAGAEGSGKPTQIDYPGGLRVSYTYGADGRPQALSGRIGDTQFTLASNIQWQPLINRLSKLTYGNGLTYERKRDAGGRLAAIHLSNGTQSLYNFNLGYDSRNRVAAYGDIRFGYDDQDHLAEQRLGDTLQRTLLQHDANGNLQQVQAFNTAGTLIASNTLSYDGNRLLQENQTPTPAFGQTYQYDLSGYPSTLGDILFGYDTARNLVYFVGDNPSRYVYDGERRRVMKIATGIRQRYVYDRQHHLLYEQSANGARRNYVWLGDIPLAVVDQTANGTLAAVYFIETDFTNTPRYLRRASGNLNQPVWHWPIAPYGNTAAQEDPDGDGAKVTFNLRYPGQYYDSESGLHYNHTRFFNPRTGRYLQPDLLKLEGGINVYTYANGNPVHYMDPTGTSWWGFASAIFNSAKSFLGFAQKVDKVEKAVNTAQKAEKSANAMARGREAEARVLNDLGLKKNTEKVSTAEGNAIPDALTKNKSIEIKDAESVARTKQIRIQTEAAKASGREPELITGTNTRVSKQARDAFEGNIIRRDDLGPQ